MNAILTKRASVLMIAFAAAVQSAHAFYNAGTGRWLSRDPIGERAGLNLHRFCKNNPANRVDPNGLSDGAFFYFMNFGYDSPPPPSPRDGGISIPSGNDSQQNLFDTVARESADEWTRADTAQEMFAFMQRLTKNNCCIRNLTFAGHGWGSRDPTPERIRNAYRGPGIPGATAGVDGLYENGTAHDKGGATLADLGTRIQSGRIRFCKPCLIQIHSCRISSSFIQSLAALTKCKVVAASSSCRPYGPNPRNWESVPGVWWENPRYSPTAGYNGFWSSDGGAPIEQIGSIYEPQ